MSILGKTKPWFHHRHDRHSHRMMIGRYRKNEPRLANEQNVPCQVASFPKLGPKCSQRKRLRSSRLVVDDVGMYLCRWMRVPGHEDDEALILANDVG